MNHPKTTLEQWRTLQTVIDQGGFAQAATQLHRSQSAISYSLAKLQQMLGVELLEIRGRRAELTATGQQLLLRARALLKDAGELEQLAQQIKQGWEIEIELVFDAIFPSSLLLSALQSFASEHPLTRIQLREVVLSGAEDALRKGEADLVISPLVPSGYIGEKLLEVEFIAVAHPDHPLHHQGSISYQQLKNETQLVIRDSGLFQQRDFGWLGAKHRWTVSNIATSINAIRRGLGFGWLPAHAIDTELREGLLKALPLQQGQRRQALLYLIMVRGETAGPATRLLAELLLRSVRSHDDGSEIQP
ncbi:MAG: LysR family transcriptional regulator [Gammaproteobacteria bacterium]|nr:LysR family transcriptional regulator [Gammaproteobacteria bacterium]